MARHTAIRDSAVTDDDMAITHVEDVPLDLDDPHRAALEQNPNAAEIPSLKSILAIIVCKYALTKIRC